MPSRAICFMISVEIRIVIFWPSRPSRAPIDPVFRMYASMSGWARRIAWMRLPSSSSGPTMKGFVPTSRLACPARVGSPAEVSIDSPSMKNAAPCSGDSFATTGTTSFRRVMKTILCAFGRSIPSSVPWMNRRRTTPRPLDVSVVSQKSMVPSSRTVTFSKQALGETAASQSTRWVGSSPSVLM
jgi:hypothetical protein